MRRYVYVYHTQNTQGNGEKRHMTNAAANLQILSIGAQPTCRHYSATFGPPFQNWENMLLSQTPQNAMTLILESEK